jgi:hypothetical protein
MQGRSTWVCFLLEKSKRMFPSTVTIPGNISLIPVDTRVVRKILFLPTVSTNAGRFLSLKDYYGTASNSTFTISTTGTDLIDDYNPLYTFSNAFGSLTLVSDGLRSWRMMNVYNGALTPAGPSTFSPLSIPGLQFWYDANDQTSMTFSGSIVTQWGDKSGNSRNLNQNSGATFATNSLVFTGGQSYNAANSANLLRNTFFSIFVVERVNTGAYLFGDTVAGRTGGSLHVGYRSLTNLTFAFWSSDLEITSISGSGVTRIWSFVLPGTGNRFVNLNGSLIGTFGNNAQLTSFDTLQVGGVFNGERYNGTMFEIVGYTGSLTTLQNQQVEGYLAWKWGLQGNLPANHPYKNAPP